MANRTHPQIKAPKRDNQKKQPTSRMVTSLIIGIWFIIGMIVGAQRVFVQQAPPEFTTIPINDFSKISPTKAASLSSAPAKNQATNTGTERPKIPCTSAVEEPFTMGKHGYQTWSGPQLRSFHQAGQAICIPDGWEAIGAQQAGPDWATYVPDKTGVMIRPDTFTATLERVGHTKFTIKIVYPKSSSATDVSGWITMVHKVFSRAGRLYPNFPDALAKPYTVLVTAGIAGDTLTEETRVFPDPHQDLSVISLTSEQPRAEEVLIHSVIHLYNRYRKSISNGDQPGQPIPAEDFQEMEATWAESALVSSSNARMLRLEYLYKIHTAVQTKNFFLTSGPPFDDRVKFNKIRPDVISQPDSTEMELEYGHYILGPLVMLAIEGRLLQRMTENKIEPVSVESILTDMHTGTRTTFFKELQKILPSSDLDDIRGWMHQGQTIPWELVLSAAEKYTTQ